MWQEILAVDSKLSHYRTMAQERDLRPLYMKRRLQLLQGQQQQLEAQSGNGSGPVRNKRYLSLRVKLLKRQFGLPSDVLSLKSLSLQNSAAAAPSQRGLERLRQTTSEAEWSANPDVLNENEVASASSSSRNSDRFSFSGVHHIFDQHSEAISRLKFCHGASSSFFVCGSMDGSVSICDLQTSSHQFLGGGHTQGVVDLDLSESDQCVISAAMDGTLILWDLKERAQLRCVQGLVPGAYIRFCRFLPQNNNLVVCGISTGVVNIVNISTGKFVLEGSPLLGKSLSVELNAMGTLLWVGNDRGHVESFVLDCEHGVRVQKGCRVSVSNQLAQPVTALCLRANLGKICANPCLLVNRNNNAIHLFSIVDDFGTLEPLMSFSSHMRPVLLSSLFAPILSFRDGLCVASGAEDGSLLFFDLEKKQRACVNKLLGHSKPVISLGFSHDENFIASADSSGQIIVWKK